jgi:excisionase family DNA binding protein
MMEPLLTIEHAAELLDVSQGALRKWIRNGLVPHVKIQRAIRLRKSDLEALVARNLRHGQR